jgi:hypothetical protein
MSVERQILVLVLGLATVFHRGQGAGRDRQQASTVGMGVIESWPSLFVLRTYDASRANRCSYRANCALFGVLRSTSTALKF